MARLGPKMAQITLCCQAGDGALADDLHHISRAQAAFFGRKCKLARLRQPSTYGREIHAQRWAIAQVKEHVVIVQNFRAGDII